MRIPKEITDDDIRQAIADLQAGISHPFGPPTRYELVYEGERLPPKAVVGLAARRVLGRIPRPREIYSGIDPGNAVHFLRKRGYTVVDKAPPRQEEKAAAVVDDAGNPLDARFVIEAGEDAITLVLHARGGTGGTQAAINTEYSTGLQVLLQRLAALGASLTDARVDTKQTRALSASERRIQLASRSYPLPLDAGVSPIDLGKELQAGQAVVARKPGAKGAGNPTRRIRLYLSIPSWEGRSATGLERLLSSGGPAPDPALEPTADPEEFEERVRTALRTPPTPEEPPPGTQSPKKSSRNVSSGYERDPRVKAHVLWLAEGQCELCLQDAPFLKSDGLPYLEVHHPWMLAEGGPDTIDNAVALCPACHRELHSGEKREEKLTALYAQVPRLKPQQ